METASVAKRGSRVTGAAFKPKAMLVLLESAQAIMENKKLNTLNSFINFTL
jgi:hypothetical protein